MIEQTIQKVIDGLNKCTKKACLMCPYNERSTCMYELHKDAYEVVTYLDGLRRQMRNE